MHTGDAGFFDPKTGHLKIIDRAKDVGRLNDGTLFAPKYIENKLKFYPNIKEAVAFGDRRDFVCVIHQHRSGRGRQLGRAQQRRLRLLSGARRPSARLRHDRRSMSTEVNRSLAAEPAMAGAQIRRFLILPKELDADDGELTRTQKVRRGFIAERYAPLVKALYDGSQRGRHLDRGHLRGRPQGRASRRASRSATWTSTPVAPGLEKAA